jgi:hypothetical protein
LAGNPLFSPMSFEKSLTAHRSNIPDASGTKAWSATSRANRIAGLSSPEQSTMTSSYWLAYSRMSAINARPSGTGSSPGRTVIAAETALTPGSLPAPDRARRNKALLCCRSTS